MAEKTVAIAGAGIGGLAAGIAFLQRGWNATAYEQSDDIRIPGAGIYIWENGLRVLESLGVYDQVVSGAIQVKRRERRDAQGNLFGFEATIESGRLFVPLRRSLLVALRDQFVALGGKLVFGQRADGASPEGTLRFKDGREVRADLIIGADGINSKVRDSLGLLRKRRPIDQFAYRSMIPRKPEELLNPERAYVCEHWNGGRRLLYAPSTADFVYVQLTSLKGDPIAGQFDRAAWLQTFPHLSWIIERISAEGYSDWFETIRLRKWSSGKVAVIGDAAGAQPPFLGQGGGMAMCQALSLAEHVSKEPDLGRALAQWERREKSFTEWVQSVSAWYGSLARMPHPVRHHILKLVGGTPWLRERTIRVAAVRDPIPSI